MLAVFTSGAVICEMTFSMFLLKELPKGSRVIRLMPNTPALVQSGVSVFSRGSHTLPDDGELVERFASTFGICEEMAEKHLDAVTGLSASGPGFVSLINFCST